MAKNSKFAENNKGILQPHHLVHVICAQRHHEVPGAAVFVEVHAEDLAADKAYLVKCEYHSQLTGRRHRPEATKDYRVEPFKLNTNYIDIWAYNLADGINKRFKTDRIGEVEILRDDWEHEDSHEAEALDAFRIHGNDPVHVAIRMDMVARNLLLEEYQLRL